MARKLTTEIFIERSKLAHGDKYDYSKSVYTSATAKTIITCKIHGDFYQKTSHHMSGHGCKSCSDIDRGLGNRLQKAEILKRFNEKHKGKYDYSLADLDNESGVKIKIICPIHGVFQQVIQTHFTSGCNDCGNEKTAKRTRKTNDQFINESKKIHGDRYIYSNVEYKNANQKVDIICRMHGVFSQIACDHLNGKGCKKCGNIKMIRNKKKNIGFNGYTRTKYMQMASKNHNGKSHIYIVKATSNDGEEFYKVGISMYSVKRRYASHFPYIVDSYVEKSLDAGLAWDLEKHIHKVLKCFSYKPKIKFAGSTECFSRVPNEIYEMIDSLVLLKNE